MLTWDEIKAAVDAKLEKEGADGSEPVFYVDLCKPESEDDIEVTFAPEVGISIGG